MNLGALVLFLLQNQMFPEEAFKRTTALHTQLDELPVSSQLKRDLTGTDTECDDRLASLTAGNRGGALAGFLAERANGLCRSPRPRPCDPGGDLKTL